MEYDWIKCGDAYLELKRRFTTHNPMTIRKAIIGMIIAAELPTICERFEEVAFVHLTNENTSHCRNPWPHTSGNAPICDFWRFWRYGMAIRPNSEASFASGNFGNDIHLLSYEIPYRFFKSNFEREHHPAQLIQSASKVCFSKPHLDSLFADRRWLNIWPKKAEPQRPGIKKQWLWDEVKAALTVEIAHNPEMLEGNAIDFVKKMEELFDAFGPNGGSPDRSDLFKYARKIVRQARPPEPVP